MKPKLILDKHHGPPSEPLPDRTRTPPPPWSVDFLIGTGRVRQHSLSPDGSRIAFIWDRDGHSDLWLLATDAPGWPERLTFHRPAHTYWDDSAPRWSPNGRDLAYMHRGAIWLVSTDDGQSRKLFGEGKSNHSPSFDPDGRRLFFLNQREGRTQLNVLAVGAPSSDWPNALTSFDGHVSDPQVSPDGRRVVFVYHPSDDLLRTELHLLDVESGEIRPLTGAVGVQDLRPRWAPDSSQLIFISNRSGWTELVLLHPESGQVTPLGPGGCDVRELAWAPNGRQVAYIANQSGNGVLSLFELVGGAHESLREEPGWHSRPQWMPQGDGLTFEFESPLTPPDLYRLQLQGGVQRLTRSDSPAQRAAGFVQPALVRYPSGDGTQVPAFLFRPPGADSKKPCPAIVHPHGGPTSEAALEWMPMVQWWLAKGYAVLRPNYRGSTGYGLDYQRALHGRWGIVDTEDVLAGADYLAAQEWIDGDRLGIYGTSYGSYLAVLALARDAQRRFRCAAAIFGDSDILRSWAQGDRIGREDLERQMGHPRESREAYAAGSPLYDVESISAPIFVAHGSQDRRVHPKQSEELIQALERHGKTYEYVVYEGEGHGFLDRTHRKHFFKRVERFFDWYLL